MRLYLIRHGKAMSETEDPERPLTAEGKREAERMATFLKPRGLNVRSVRHSGKARAEQTARILAPAFRGAETVEARAGLKPNDDIGPVMDGLKEEKDDLAIVGHMPFLGKLLSALVIGDAWTDIVRFEAAMAVCLERDGHGGWALQWALPPKLLL